MHLPKMSFGRASEGVRPLTREGMGRGLGGRGPPLGLPLTETDHNEYFAVFVIEQNVV